MTDPGDLLERDRRALWHPFTQHGIDAEPLPVAAATDATLRLEDGRELIDAISSWWCCLHGHGRPELVEALSRQADRLDHTLLAGTTHAPAVELAERLVEITPEGLERVFFSDNGSTSVEVALKLAYQRWVHRGEPQRRVFVALEGGYHGDTFGAMAVGDPDPFFAPFTPLLFEARRAPAREGAVEGVLEELGDRAAAVIVEPLVQGAAGMRFHAPEVVASVRAACDRHGVPMIADEVMTGFGRTGGLFACEQAGVTPDLLCLSKGLTGGMMPLAATLATGEIFESFLSEDRSRLFAHGHTYTGNPIGCAVARKSLELTLEEDVPGRLARIGARIHRRLEDLLAGDERVADLRVRGGIVAFDLATSGEGAGYYARRAPGLRRAAVERGVLLRPLGDVVYAMPPACTTDEQCDRIATVMAALVDIA